MTRAVIVLRAPGGSDVFVVGRWGGNLAGAGRDLAILLNATDGRPQLVAEAFRFGRSEDPYGDRYLATAVHRMGRDHQWFYEVIGSGSSVRVGVWNRPDGGGDWQALMKPSDGTKFGPDGPGPGEAGRLAKRRKSDTDHIALPRFVDLINRANRKLAPVPMSEHIAHDESLLEWLDGWRSVPDGELLACLADAPSSGGAAHIEVTS